MHANSRKAFVTAVSTISEVYRYNAMHANSRKAFVTMLIDPASFEAEMLQCYARKQPKGICD